MSRREGTVGGGAPAGPDSVRSPPRAYRAEDGGAAQPQAGFERTQLLFQAAAIQHVMDEGALSHPADQPRLPQNAKMLRHRRLGHVQPRCERIHAEGTMAARIRLAFPNVVLPRLASRQEL